MAPTPRLLHGTIEAEIFHTTPYNFDRSRWRRALRGVLKAKARLHVTVSLDSDSAPIARTADVIHDPARSTEWNQTIRAYCAHNAAQVIFSIAIQSIGIKFKGVIIVGRAYLPVAELLDPELEVVPRWFPVMDPYNRQCELAHNPQIYLQIKFDAAAAGQAHTFFRQRPGSRVTLYQDAHCLDSSAPDIQLGRCWKDVFDAINEAQHLVYITGWSVNTDIRLVRPGGKTLGELLKRKASEGVRVLLLVWKDPTSFWVGPKNFDVPLVGQHTHDKETEAYFSDSKVHCVLVSNKWGYSHHQKTIIVDHAVPQGAAPADVDRHIVSFLGGLDLCDGRYDTQSHCLFRTLDAEHKGDFHQICLEGASSDLGPRMPWHDIHSKIEGPAAWDVLDNFVERWKKQQGAGDGHLVDLTDDMVKLKPRSWEVVPASDNEAWNVQVFRSIDSTTVANFPVADGTADSITAVTNAGLVCGRNNMSVDRSVQDAYIHAIRRAKNFIYIENQYFIGSAFQWPPGSAGNVSPQNLVPRELSLKIKSKIEAREPFAVYVVLPMWSDGLPNSLAVQEMLYYQRNTIEMMYKDVADALLKAKMMDAKMTDASPRDYLTFFWLGNRERELELKSGAAPPGTPAQKARRFMIYVHSKMMIVDDEYIIVGSANINQRSMDGARDTEIAMGAYQPYYLNANSQGGQVHGFRMSLWYEHLGSKDHVLLNPGDRVCVRRVNRMADENWSCYKQEDPCDLPFHHLLPYPITVSEDGSVTYSMECFLDTEAPVRGKKISFLKGVMEPFIDDWFIEKL